MGCGVRPPQGLGIKALVYEFLVLKIGESLFLKGDNNTRRGSKVFLEGVLGCSLAWM